MLLSICYLKDPVWRNPLWGEHPPLPPAPPNVQYQWQHFTDRCMTKRKLFSHICSTTEVKTELWSLRIPWNVPCIPMKNFQLKLLFTPQFDRKKTRLSLSRLYSMKQIASHYDSLHFKLSHCLDWRWLTVSSFIFRSPLQWKYSRH